MYHILATAMPLYMQWIVSILYAAIALSLIVGICGALCCRLGQDKKLPTASLYAGSKFPTRWDVVFTVLFLLYYTGSITIDAFSEQPEAEAEKMTTSAYMLLVVFLFTALQYIPMVLRLALLPAPGAYLATEDGKTLPPLPDTAPQPRPRAATLLREFMLALLAALAIIFISALYEVSGISDLITQATGSPKYQELVELLFERNGFTSIIILAGAVIVAPIGEECCFRGFLYGSLRKYAGPVWAAICSSLVFAAVHMSLTAMLPLTIFALVQCLLYEKTKTLRVPMMTHAIFNALEVCAAFYFPPQA